ncbi:MAG: CpaF family protein [Geminicoccaceae bacterium]
MNATDTHRDNYRKVFYECICDRKPLSLKEFHLLCRIKQDKMNGHGTIEPFLRDPTISDIMINAQNEIYIERYGRIYRTKESFQSSEEVFLLAQKIANLSGKRLDTSNPILDTRLPDGSRVNIVTDNVSIDSCVISIRKFQKSFSSLSKLVQGNTTDPATALYLATQSRMRRNILISGSTGAGKTTLLNALSSFISPKERVITIEDTAELVLQQPNVIRLESRSATVSRKEVSIAALLKTALRMRPDRIIIGEIRGDEAFDFIQALNTGHSGSMGTIHSNTPSSAIERLLSLVLSAKPNLKPDDVRAQIASAINVIVQVKRDHDGNRKIVDVLNMTDNLI